MNKHDTAENTVDTTVVRPLARVIARELSNDEVSMVTGAGSGGNGLDGTTHGNAFTDKDWMQ